MGKLNVVTGRVAHRIKVACQNRYMLHLTSICWVPNYRSIIHSLRTYYTDMAGLVMRGIQKATYNIILLITLCFNPISYVKKGARSQEPDHCRGPGHIDQSPTEHSTTDVQCFKGSKIPVIPHRIIQIHHIRFKVLGRHLALKHDVELLKRATFGLRDAQVRPDEAEEGDAAEEEAQFASHVRLVRVDHVGDGYGHDHANRCLHGGGECDGSAADSGGGDFAEDDICDWTDGDVEEEIP